jgi:hypothetical protein
MGSNEQPTNQSPRKRSEMMKAVPEEFQDLIEDETKSFSASNTDLVQC